MKEYINKADLYNKLLEIEGKYYDMLAKNEDDMVEGIISNKLEEAERIKHMVFDMESIEI